MGASAATAPVDDRVVELVAPAKDGDAEALAELYDRYVDEIFGYVYRRVGHRQQTEGLVADVFVRA